MDRHDWHLVAWWGVLLALTLLSFESIWGIAWLRRPELAAILVIAVALAKVRVVILQFMEVKEAPWQLRAPLETWVVVIAVAILAVGFL